MDKWKRKRLADERKTAAKAAQRKVDLAAAVKLLSRLVPGMKQSTHELEKRAEVVKHALEILAGERSLLK